MTFQRCLQSFVWSRCTLLWSSCQRNEIQTINLPSNSCRLHLGNGRQCNKNKPAFRPNGWENFQLQQSKNKTCQPFLVPINMSFYGKGQNINYFQNRHFMLKTKKKVLYANTANAALHLSSIQGSKCLVLNPLSCQTGIRASAKTLKLQMK